MSQLAYALGLVLIIEGLLPLVAPQMWREVFTRMATQTNGQLRFVGLMFVLAGAAVLMVR